MTCQYDVFGERALPSRMVAVCFRLLHSDTLQCCKPQHIHVNGNFKQSNDDSVSKAVPLSSLEITLNWGDEMPTRILPDFPGRSQCVCSSFYSSQSFSEKSEVVVEILTFNRKRHDTLNILSTTEVSSSGVYIRRDVHLCLSLRILSSCDQHCARWKETSFSSCDQHFARWKESSFSFCDQDRAHWKERSHTDKKRRS